MYDQFNVLVVDDELDVLDVLLGTFEDLNIGENFIFAKNGEEALKIFEENRIDLVFSDLRMPGVSGLDLLYKFRADGYRGEFVFITGYIGDIEETVKNLGGCIVLSKPFKSQQLLEVTKTCLLQTIQDRMALRELYELIQRPVYTTEDLLEYRNEKIKTRTRDKYNFRKKTSKKFSSVA